MYTILLFILQFKTVTSITFFLQNWGLNLGLCYFAQFKIFLSITFSLFSFSFFFFSFVVLGFELWGSYLQGRHSTA
jgi:hypothetical protein